jgi:hypothetical protein
MQVEYKNFATRIDNTSGSNRQVICESSLTHNLRISFLMMSIELNSLSEAIKQSKKVALSIKTANEDWRDINSFLIYQSKPTYTENLLVYLSNQAELILAINTKLAVSIMATDTGLLAAGDVVHVWGSGELFIAG